MSQIQAVSHLLDMYGRIDRSYPHEAKALYFEYKKHLDAYIHAGVVSKNEADQFHAPARVRAIQRGAAGI